MGSIRLLRAGELVKFVSMATVVLEVLDARVPEFLRNRSLDRILSRSGIDHVVVLNKVDLVPTGVVREWVEYYRSLGFEVVRASARVGDVRELRSWINIYAERLRERGKGTIAVVGAPKVGKSSIINTLRRRRVAGVSRYPGNPGYTKNYQLIRLRENLYMIDTPGFLPVTVDLLEKTIRENPPEKIGNAEKIAIKIIERVARFDRYAILKAYGISSTDPLSILEELARSRGWISRGSGEPLIREASLKVIRDYLEGRLNFYTQPSNWRGYLVRSL